MLSPGWRAHTCLKLMAGCAVCESDSSRSKEQEEEEEERPGEMHKDLSRRRRISRAGITVGRRKRRKRRRRRVRRGGGRGEERKRRRRQREKRCQDLPVSLTAVSEVLQNNNPLCRPCLPASCAAVIASASSKFEGILADAAQCASAMKEMYDAELAAGTSLHTANQLQLGMSVAPSNHWLHFQTNVYNIKPVSSPSNQCLHH